MFRKHERENFGSADRADDAVGIEGTRGYIPRGDPAFKSVPLQGLDDGIGDGDILGSVADEDRGRIAARPGLAVAFRHFEYPRSLSRMVADGLRVGNPRGSQGRGASASRR